MKQQIVLLGNSAKTGDWIEISEKTNLISIHIYSKKGTVGEPEQGLFNGTFVIEQSHSKENDVGASETFNYSGNTPKIFQTGIKAPYLRVKCVDWAVNLENYFYASLIEYE